MNPPTRTTHRVGPPPLPTEQHIPACGLSTLLVALLAACLFSACLPRPAAEPLPVGADWPVAVDAGRMVWQPRSMRDSAAARRALADIAPLLQVPGRAKSSVQTHFSTPELLVFKTAWTEYEWRTPTYERWPQHFCFPYCEEPAGPPERVAVRRENALVLPLDRLDDIRLYLAEAADSAGNPIAPWRVRVFHERGRSLELAAVDRESQTLLADALSTLAEARGFARPAPALPLFADLTPAQAQLLEIPGGALVLSWPLDPDAAAMLPSWPDVVLRVDGEPATAALLEQLLQRRMTQNSPPRLEILRWGLYNGFPKLRKEVFGLSLTLPEAP